MVGWERPLVARIADGDDKALLELRDRLGDSIFNRALLITNDRMVATFVTTGVLMRVWRCPADFAGRDLPAALLSLAEQRAREWRSDPPPVVLRLLKQGACDD
jgi:hypothetical protein